MEKHKKKRTHPIFWSIVVLVAIFCLMRLYFMLTDDFRLANITNDMPFQKEWEIPDLTAAEKQNIQGILAQRFSYIGKGSQCYAFVSDDGGYVIKFFKFKHLRPNWFVEMLPRIPPFSTYRNKQAMRKLRKLYGVFEGYRLAYEEHKGDSGLIFVHLNKTKNVFGNVTLIDKLGLERNIHLDDVVFVIQEKTMTTRKVIEDALKNGDIDTVKLRLGQIVDLYLKEYNKGIFDKDHGVLHNTGFVGEKPIHLDVGKLVQCGRIKQQKVYEPDLVMMAERAAKWIKASYPKQYPEIARHLEDKLSQSFGHQFKFKEPFAITQEPIADNGPCSKK